MKLPTTTATKNDMMQYLFGSGNCAPINAFCRNLSEKAWMKKSPSYTVAEYLLRMDRDISPTEHGTIEFMGREDYILTSHYCFEHSIAANDKNIAAIVAEYYEYIEQQAATLLATGTCAILEKFKKTNKRHIFN